MSFLRHCMAYSYAQKMNEILRCIYPKIANLYDANIYYDKQMTGDFTASRKA
jgi:hypothetical protein